MSSPAPPRRRFLPQPVESSSRSSKRLHLESTDQPSTSPTVKTEANGEMVTSKPRRFLPQPIEESTRSSRRKNAEKDTDTDKSENGLANNPTKPNTHPDDSVHTDGPTPRPSTSSRRFAPEPVETTARTSRRKFAVEPVETTTRSSKDKQEKDQNSSPTSRPRRKFAPEPVETTTSRRRRRDQDEDSNESPTESPSESSSRVSSRQSTGSRRFSPDLIETAKGSYRHKKDPDFPTRTHHGGSSPPISRTTTRSPEPTEPSESRFSAAALAKRCHEEHRKHSYCVPNLPIIESDSDESPPPSLTESTLPSLAESPSSTDNEYHKLNRIEESAAETYHDYMLSLTNSEERKQLQEQAMAAYVNEVPHNQVAHFAADDDEDDFVHVGTLSGNNGADPRTFRRMSQADHDWEMQNMRKHHEQLERAKRELHQDTAGASRFSAAALASRHHLGQVHKQPAKTQKQKEEEAVFAKMRQAASPPMLGSNLVFPYTVSPKMTRCDVDQAPRPRRADSDDDRMSVESGPTQLWSAQSATQTPQGAGLWMGLCQKAPEPSRPPTPIRSGLQTPAYEASNPFESPTPRGARTPGRKGPRPYSGIHLLPISPPRSTESSGDEFISSIDKKLRLEKQIEEEFHPRVITQIYNYLSLGFPNIARDFDAELSKISRIPIKELRKDDDVATGAIKGYVGAPEAEGVWEEEEDGSVKGCRRWEALKLYVQEWARQSPNFASEQRAPVKQDPALAQLKSMNPDAWSATGRRGSWAQ